MGTGLAKYRSTIKQSSAVGATTGNSNNKTLSIILATFFLITLGSN
jgi:hypothetical protein